MLGLQVFVSWYLAFEGNNVSQNKEILFKVHMYVDKHTYIYYRFLGKWIMIRLLHFQTSCWSFTLLLYLLFPATYVEPSPFSNFPHQIICIMLLTSLFLPALRNGPFLLSWLLYLFHDLVTCEDLKPGASHQRDVTLAFLGLGGLTQCDLFQFYHFACYVHYFTFLYS